MQLRSEVKTEGGNFYTSTPFTLTPQFSFTHIFSFSEQTETGSKLANGQISPQSSHKTRDWSENLAQERACESVPVKLLKTVLITLYKA